MFNCVIDYRMISYVSYWYMHGAWLCIHYGMKQFIGSHISLCNACSHMIVLLTVKFVIFQYEKFMSKVIPPIVISCHPKIYSQFL